MAMNYFDYAKYNSGRFVSCISGRARRNMFGRFMKQAAPQETCLVLDVGVTPDNAKEPNNFFEKMYPWTDMITMCSFEDAKNLEEEFPGSRFVRNEPGKPLPFKDNQFDLVFCSAVLEHVGNNKEQRFFLRELVRVGKKIFLTTPNRWFPIEVHTVLPLFHWFPQSVHQKILKMLGRNFFAETCNLNLLSRRKLSFMLRSLNLQICWKISSYKLLGMTSNLILYVERDESLCAN